MQRLGEILIERGELSLTELHTALETCHLTGGRLGTQLLEFGYIEEHMLLDALSRQLNVPSVVRVELLHSSIEVRKLLPPSVGRRLQAIAFESTRRGIKVAMTNPNDRAAIDEISTYVRDTVLPHVATETAVLAALGGAETDDADWSPEAPPTAADERRNWEVEGWNRLWEPPRFRPASLFGAGKRRSPRRTVLLASFPNLAPLASGEAGGAEPGIDRCSFPEYLHSAEHRDEIGSVLTRFAASMYDRVCLFSVHQGIVTGWMARGRSVVLDDLQSFSVSLDEPSLFADVGHADHYVGAILKNKADGELIRALADPEPEEVVLIPVRVKQRVVAYLMCDDPGHPASQEDLDALVIAARKAGIAFEVLIMRKKILATS